MKKTKAPPSPLDLLFMLADSCMHKVSPEAWKVISYVAVQHIRVYPEYLERLKSPLARQWNLDVESRGMINILPDASDGNERPYRPWNGPGLPQTDSGPRGVVLSVQQIRNGLRTKRRWRDHGTGLGRTSAYEAIKEAETIGILVRQRRNIKGKDVASLYGIEWDRVQELDRQRQKNLGQPEKPPK